jgi:predicted phosphate transport protein (TIGR00153 family)
MTWIQNLFRSSPVKPMQEHMRVVVACARKVPELIEAMIAADHERVREVRREIDELEHRADQVKNEIRANLPRRLFMAMDRRDMLEILDAQDSIADTAQDVAGMADQRKMTVPESLREPLRELVQKVVATCEQAQAVIDELDELLESGFQGREVGRVEEMIESLGRIETDTDALAENLARRLFAIESELGVGTVFWYEMIGWIADLADYAERVGNRLRLLIAS